MVPPAASEVDTRLRRGWATQSFQHAVRSAFFAGVLVWTVVVLAAYFAGPEQNHHGGFVVAANLLLAGVAAVALLDPRVPASPVFLVEYATFVANWSLTAGPSTPFAVASYQIFIFAAVSQGLVVRSRRGFVFSVLCSVACAATVFLLEPGDGWRIPLTLLVTGPLAIAVARPGLEPLLRFARSADANHDQAVRATVRLEAQRDAVRRAAEQQRRVHDTAINTLAAIVRGGQAVADPDAVRARCRDDSLVLEKLLNMPTGEEATSASPEVTLAGRTIAVTLSGLSGPELASIWRTLPLGVRTAIGGAVNELVTNAEKHSGADEVVVDVRTGTSGGLRVSVSDRGRGFDPAVTVERGLALSVRARLAEEEITFDLDAAPGEGVQANLAWHAAAENPGTRDGAFTADVDRIRMLGALLISSLLAGGGALLAATNYPGELSPDYLMVALTAATTLLVWRSWRRQGRLSGACTAALVLLAPIAFLLSGWSVSFGDGYNLAWQCVAPALLLFMVVAGANSRWLVAAAFAMYAAVGVAAAVLLADTGDAAAVTLVVVATGLVWVGGWAEFNRQLRAMAARAVREFEQAVRDDEAADAQQTARLIRERWRMAGIESAAGLLRELATTMDPASAQARQRSHREETYLRQVIQLPPEIVHMGAWFCRALAGARDRDVNLRVRSGPEDLDAATADLLGQFVVDATAVVSPGTEVVVSLFGAGADSKLRLVTADERVATLARTRVWGDGLVVEVRQFVGQVLVQVGRS